MMKAAILVGVCLAGGGAARADGLDQVPKLGFSLGYGALPVHAEDTRATSLGLDVEHPVFGATRVFASWEWLWLSDADPMQPVHGSGQRANLGLRRALAVGGNGHTRVFLDAELGGGATLATDDTMGTRVVGDVLTGLRLGFDLRNGDSSSRVFEMDAHLLAIIVPHDWGLTFGVGMAWGD